MRKGEKESGGKEGTNGEEELGCPSSLSLPPFLSTSLPPFPRSLSSPHFSPFPFSVAPPLKPARGLEECCVCGLGRALPPNGFDAF